MAAQMAALLVAASACVDAPKASMLILTSGKVGAAMEAASESACAKAVANLSVRGCVAQAVSAMATEA